MNSPAQSSCYNGFDIAKFIMAIFVVTLHAQPFSDFSFNLNYAVTHGVTRMAVPYFFMASGFLLFRKMSFIRLDKMRIRKYLVHIFRLYVLWTIIYLPVILYTNIYKPHNGMLHGVVIVIRNMLMNGSYLQLWFLHALLMSAIALAVLLYFRLSSRRIFLILLSFHMIAIVGLHYYGLVDYFFPAGSDGYSVLQWLKWIFVTPRNGLCFGAVYFFIGAYLSQKASDLSLPRLKRYIVVFFMLFMIEVMGGSFCGWTQLNYSHDVYIMLLPLTYCVFLYTKAVRLPDSPVWGYLRKQSMFIFYIHAWWLGLARAAFGGSKPAFVHLGSLEVYLIALGLSVLTSHILIVLSRKEKFSYLKYLS